MMIFLPPLSVLHSAVIVTVNFVKILPSIDREKLADGNSPGPSRMNSRIKTKHCERCMTQSLKIDVALNDFLRIISNAIEVGDVKERQLYLQMTSYFVKGISTQHCCITGLVLKFMPN